MFTETAAFYDAIYAARGKDYVREADAVVAHLRRVRPDATSLLDVGCGTGAHLARFQRTGRAAGHYFRSDRKATTALNCFDDSAEGPEVP